MVAVLAEALELVHIVGGPGLAVAPMEIALFRVGEQERLGLEQHAVIVFALGRLQDQIGLDGGGQFIHINAEFSGEGRQWFGGGKAAGYQ